MTLAGRDAVRKVAARVYRDPTAGTIDDLRKLSAAVLLLIDGKLPGKGP